MNPSIKQFLDFRQILKFVGIYKNLKLHIRGVEVVFPSHVTEQELEKVVDGVAFGLGLTQFTKTAEYKELRKKYLFPQGVGVVGEKSFDLELYKTETDGEKKVVIFVRSYEKETSGEFTVESLIQTIVTNLQEGFSTDMKSIRRLEMNELPPLKWYVYLFIGIAKVFYPLLILVSIVALLPVFFKLLAIVTDIFSTR